MKFILISNDAKDTLFSGGYFKVKECVFNLLGSCLTNRLFENKRTFPGMRLHNSVILFVLLVPPFMVGEVL